MPPRPASFCIFSRDGVRRVGQAVLKLLTSGDPPTSTSQSVGITGVSHCAWPNILERRTRKLPAFVHTAQSQVPQDVSRNWRCYTFSFGRRPLHLTTTRF
uniref:Uncharacterized protein n=1 Tax=Macaca fascicularis TaxID=9541 RepID=A0A7N9D6N7_MACFA